MLLTEIGALKDGTIQKVEVDSVTDAVTIEISGIVQYLADRDRLTDLEEWGTIELGVKDQPDVDVPTFFMDQIGLEFSYWGHYVEDPLYFNTVPGPFFMMFPATTYFSLSIKVLMTIYASEPSSYSWNSEGKYECVFR